MVGGRLKIILFDFTIFEAAFLIFLDHVQRYFDEVASSQTLLNRSWNSFAWKLNYFRFHLTSHCEENEITGKRVELGIVHKLYHVV